MWEKDILLKIKYDHGIEYLEHRCSQVHNDPSARQESWHYSNLHAIVWAQSAPRMGREPQKSTVTRLLPSAWPAKHVMMVIRFWFSKWKGLSEKSLVKNLWSGDTGKRWIRKEWELGVCGIRIRRRMSRERERERASNWCFCQDSLALQKP